MSTIDKGDAVTVEVVRRYFGGRADVRGFEIADAAIDGRINVALEQARWAEAAKVAPVLITSAFASGLRSLAKLADAPDGLSEAELARHIGAPPFKIRILRRQLRAWDTGVAGDGPRCGGRCRHRRQGWCRRPRVRRGAHGAAGGGGPRPGSLMPEA